jgi:hypothetical protein
MIVINVRNSSGDGLSRNSYPVYKERAIKIPNRRVFANNILIIFLVVTAVLTVLERFLEPAFEPLLVRACLTITF